MLENQKMIIDKLSLEVTRKCNLKCTHCFRGDAQSVDMTSKIINTVLSQISEINELIFTGGEPLLALEQIIFIFYTLNKYKIKVRSWQMITNGIITNKSVLYTLFNYISQNFSDCNGLIAVSHDKYHKNAMEKLGIDTKENEAVLKRMCNKFGIRFGTNEIKKTYSVGRAEKLPESVATSYLSLENDFLKNYDGLNNVLNTCLEISAKGDVIRPNCTYEKADATAYGNVLESSLQDIILRIIDMQTISQINNRFTDFDKNSKGTFSI